MVNERITITNAPAGSGKTTEIKNEIEAKIKNGESKKILCLTYTNRAVEELRNQITSNGVEITTIHSFLSKETKLLFYKNEIIDLYLQVFAKNIEKQLEDTSKKDRYIEKYEIKEEITIEVIQKNINKIKYNERKYSRYLYGELGHDDLIKFSFEISNKFEYFSIKLNGIYSTIYLDEYQDTNENFLKLINTAVEDEKSELVWNLYGDKMQEIYGVSSNIDFINGRRKNIKKNYRSSNIIIEILNNIYNQADNVVEQRKLNPYKDITPKVRFYDDSGEVFQNDNNYMNLSSNYSQIFKIITGSDSVKRYFENLLIDGKKVYVYMSDLDASTLLMNIENWKKDDLLKIMDIIFTLNKYYKAGEIGNFFEYYRRNKCLEQNKIKITSHSDRRKVEQLIVQKFNKIEVYDNILGFLEYFEDLFLQDVIENIKSSEINYFNESSKESICVDDLLKLYEFITSSSRNYNVSTQHGVKGESHKKVNLICEKNINSKIDYTLFFSIFCSQNIDIIKLEVEMKNINDLKKKFLGDTGIKNPGEMKAEDYKKNIKACENFVSEAKSYGGYTRIFLAFPEKKQVGKFNFFYKSILRYEYYITTFKIFYVGCSRAKEELIVNVKYDMIEPYEQQFLRKMCDLGFDIESNT